MNDDEAALSEFNGTARLFPLPGLVLFPHAVQPLHIFESRYREMSADALAGDRLIAPVLLRAGWEEQYDLQPEVYGVACLGRIVAEQELSDGRYNLMLRGLARVRIIDELPCDKPFRQARVEVLSDVVPDDIDELMALRNALADLVLPRITTGPIREQVQLLFHGELPLGQVCDVLSFALPLAPEVKQDLLEIIDVPDRARWLMEAFRAVVSGPAKPTGAGAGKKFPPDFSDN
jgi:uncharacterized protein